MPKEHEKDVEESLDVVEHVEKQKEKVKEEGIEKQEDKIEIKIIYIYFNNITIHDDL